MESNTPTETRMQILKQNNDALGLSKDQKMLQNFNGEQVIFSDKVGKINQSEWTQKRILVITQSNIFNLDGKKVKRTIPINLLGGFSQNVMGKKKEFSLHVPDEYDYRFNYDKRDKVKEILQCLFYNIKKQNLIIYDVPESNLKGVTTTEKMMMKKQSKMPPPQMRNISTDLVSEQAQQEVTEDPEPELNDAIDDYKNQQTKMLPSVDFVDDDGGMGFDDDEEDPQDKMDTAEIQQTITGAVQAQLVQKINRKEDAKLEDFELMRIVGKGTFGKVFQVRHKKTGKIYAMKCIRKDVVLENDQMDSLKLEKEILYNIEHPFIVGMDYVFENQERIFFLMDFIEGGELFRHLVKVRRFNNDQARFMIAQVAIALGHLHEKKIVYRDLKPENVLFNRDGYLLLADFGLATKVEEGQLAQSFCGTAEYLAPEMLKSEGHDNTVDWWTLGILLYEMLVGIPPFFHKNKHRMYYLIQEANVTFPVPEKHNIEVLPEAQDLINRLLTKNRTKRIGCGPDGIKEILAHPFFSELDIDAMMAKQLKPDYMPDINDGELKFFDQKLVNAEQVDISVIPQDKKKIVDKNKAAFDNF